MILFLFKRKLKLIVMIGLILSFILCLPTGIYIIHHLFRNNNFIFGQDGSIAFSYFFELVVIGFAIKNLKYSFYISAGTMLKSFKQNKIEEEMYIKKKRLLLDIIQ